MNRQIRDRWIAALRSGQYEQGQGALNDGGRFCCLGVLCELAVADGVLARKTSGNDSLVRYVVPGDPQQEATGALPPAVRQWAGINGGDGDIMMSAGPRRFGVIELNDLDHATFDQIATVVEHYL